MKKDTSERALSEQTGVVNQSIRSCIVLQFPKSLGEFLM